VTAVKSKHSTRGHKSVTTASHAQAGASKRTLTPAAAFWRHCTTTGAVLMPPPFFLMSSEMDVMSVPRCLRDIKTVAGRSCLYQLMPWKSSWSHPSQVALAPSKQHPAASTAQYITCCHRSHMSKGTRTGHARHTAGARHGVPPHGSNGGRARGNAVWLPNVGQPTAPGHCQPPQRRHSRERRERHAVQGAGSWGREGGGWQEHSRRRKGRACPSWPCSRWAPNILSRSLNAYSRPRLFPF